jgi:acylglycerol lipase
MHKALTITLGTVAALAVAAFAAVQLGAGSAPGACAEPSPTGPFTTWRHQAADGNCLQGYAWLPAATPVTGAVVLVHGLHDHARRYQALAVALNGIGVAVYAHDHRGHGASGGARQRLDSVAQLVADVDGTLAEAAKRHPGVPLFVYGHSMGGMVTAHVAANASAKTAPALRGAILSSAALKLPASASDGARRVVAGLSALAPGLGLEAVDEATVVRDPAARAALAADPLLSRAKLPARTVATLFDGIVGIVPRMGSITLPLLILHGQQDRVTDAQGSRDLAKLAASSDKLLRLYEPALHDLQHEPEGGAVRQEIVAFVGARLGSKP